MNVNSYSRYFDDIRSDATKKTFLKNKALLLKNSDLEVGCLFRKDREILKVMLYLTPEKDLKNMTYIINK